MVRTKTKPFLKRKKVPKFDFHFGAVNMLPDADLEGQAGHSH
jgi:hypothetical protein